MACTGSDAAGTTQRSDSASPPFHSPHHPTHPANVAVLLVTGGSRPQAATAALCSDSGARVNRRASNPGAWRAGSPGRRARCAGWSWCEASMPASVDRIE